ncbi:hypothetical protein BJ508DRAFT_326647 [Ascobolus immersus RN42]|uniref:Uncharacterized protein n=1 Tax=Ascobolus immersus RN42 TaxID=1160509 RepID=A0A3N4I587_ASCIM|nr:hypothetical protein BJ508DRAFT_326647 [Ascobolus immersus RN42]
MFGGAPPQQSQAEIKMQEQVAKLTTEFALGICAILYICGYPSTVDFGMIWRG